DDVFSIRDEVNTNARRRKWLISRNSHFILNQGGGKDQRRADCNLIAPCIGHILEYRLAVVADCDVQRTGDLQLSLPFIPLMAVTAIRATPQGLRLPLEAREEVLAARIAGIHQRLRLVLALTRLGGDGLAILRRERA